MSYGSLAVGKLFSAIYCRPLNYVKPGGHHLELYNMCLRDFRGLSRLPKSARMRRKYMPHIYSITVAELADFFWHDITYVWEKLRFQAWLKL